MPVITKSITTDEKTWQGEFCASLFGADGDLKGMLKQYYLGNLVETLFEYEFLK